MGDIRFSNNTQDSDISHGDQLVKPEPEGNISAEYCTHTHRQGKKEGVVSGLTRVQYRFRKRKRPIHILAISLSSREALLVRLTLQMKIH